MHSLFLHLYYLLCLYTCLSCFMATSTLFMLIMMDRVGKPDTYSPCKQLKPVMCIFLC